MKDLIKAQNDILREKFVHRRLNEAEPPPAGGGEDKPAEPKKLTGQDIKKIYEDKKTK